MNKQKKSIATNTEKKQKWVKKKSLKNWVMSQKLEPHEWKTR